MRSRQAPFSRRVEYGQRLPGSRSHPEPSAYAKKFTGRYAHRTIKGGIGHNLPQEAPQAFAEAVIEVVQS
jgi:pimeloyl-ACP methyl ester carboxylesterase